MSTTVALPDSSAPLLSGKAHFYLRRLHSLTGLVFGGYIVVHLIVNATLAEGGDVFQKQVDKIHSLPFLEVIEWAMIFLPLIFHTTYGIWITVSGKNNVANYGYGKNWAYSLQRVSALTIFAFALFHILALKYGLFGDSLKFEPELAKQTVVNHMHKVWWVAWIVYPIGILASTFHLANGFWTGAITWGLTVSKQSQQRFGFICSGLFLLTTIAGFTALIATLAAKPTPKLSTVETPTLTESVLKSEK